MSRLATIDLVIFERCMRLDVNGFTILHKWIGSKMSKPNMQQMSTRAAQSQIFSLPSEREESLSNRLLSLSHGPRRSETSSLHSHLEPLNPLYHIIST